MTPETVRPAPRRGRRSGGAARPGAFGGTRVGTSAGRRANAVSSALTLLVVDFILTAFMFAG